MKNFLLNQFLTLTAISLIIALEEVAIIKSFLGHPTHEREMSRHFPDRTIHNFIANTNVDRRMIGTVKKRQWGAPKF